MYLSQTVSLPTTIRIKSDLFQCTHLVQEVQLESAVATCRSWYQLPLQYLYIPGRRIGAGSDLFRVGSLGTPLFLSSDVRLGCRNPAHLEVRPYALC